MAKEPKTTAEHQQDVAEAEAQAQANLAAAEAAKVEAEAKAKADAEAAEAALKEADRKTRWAAIVERFKKERPLQYEARKHTGEFDLDKIPADLV
jgi:hypothetical protein